LAAGFVPAAAQGGGALRASAGSGGFGPCGCCAEVAPPVQGLA